MLWPDTPGWTGVPYENLMTRTTNELLQIDSFVGVDMGHVARRVVEGPDIEAGHNLGGNNLRFRDEITISLDYEWMSELPVLYRFAYGTLGPWVAPRLPYVLSAEVPEVTREGAA